jgi:hypothetical protein
MIKIILTAPFVFVCALFTASSMAEQYKMKEDMATLLNVGWRITSHAAFVTDARPTPQDTKLESTQFFSFTLTKDAKNARCEGSRYADGSMRFTQCFPLN